MRRDSGPSLRMWATPKNRRLKLNFDGSCKRITKRASIGGVFRDHEGRFVLGYAARIGKATSSVAELVALKRGLELALENGWRDISVEGDHKMVVQVVKNRVAFRSEEDARLCAEIVELVRRLGDVTASKVRRKRNKVAHGFAELGHKVAAERVWRDVAPDEVLVYIRKEAESLGANSNGSFLPTLFPQLRPVICVPPLISPLPYHLLTPPQPQFFLPHRESAFAVAPHINHPLAVTASLPLGSARAPVCMSSLGIPDRIRSVPEDRSRLGASPAVAPPNASGDGLLGAAPAMGIWSASSGPLYPLHPFKDYTIWF